MSETRKTIALTKEMMLAPPPDHSMDEIDLMDQVEEIKSWEHLRDKITYRKNSFLQKNQELENSENELKKGSLDPDEVKLSKDERHVALKRWQNLIELGELLVADDEAEARYERNAEVKHECGLRMKFLMKEKNEISFYKEFKNPPLENNIAETKPLTKPRFILRNPPNPEKILSGFVAGSWLTLFVSCFGISEKSPKSGEKEMKEYKRR